jgi:signal peptidase II
MKHAAGGNLLWGPWSRFGVAIMLVALIADQLCKWWMIYVYKIGERGKVALTPFFDLIMVWNEGISYGLFPQGSAAGRAVLIGIAVVAVLALIVWLARAERGLAAASIGLIAGGAVGNAIDRTIYGAVADFFSLHAFGYYWYIFNIADVAIVAGVAGLLYDTLITGHKMVPKSP